MSNSPATGISLDGEWRLSFGRQVAPAGSLAHPRIPADFVTITAIVPGNVELDLVRAQLLAPDLDHGDNIYLLREYEAYQWWFCRSFIIEGESPALPVLVLDGVDTIATIWINGTLVWKTANMLVPHEFALDGILRAGSNEIHIAIDSAVLESRRHPVEPGSYAHENNWDSLHVRKAAHAYGWDIMPRAVSAGLWKSVAIEFRSQTRFSDVYLATLGVDAAASSAQLLVFWNLAEPSGTFVPVRNVRLRVVEPATGRIVHEKHLAALGPRGEFRETISDVELWYPKGYGRAALYDVQLALLEGDVEVATWHS
ncbi:MAG: sugar-binding domain-containing protein, partial [Rhodothermales bacterium]